ncbi:MAG: hypothetical protein IPM29_03095 [Planctomycetes bacterium]|nr:hypothetical protein [Planctomycetota bacterium]
MADLLLSLDGFAHDWLGWLLARSLTFAVAFAVIVPPALLLSRLRWLSAHAVSLALLLPVLTSLLPLERWLPAGWPTTLPAAVHELTGNGAEAAIATALDAGSLELPAPDGTPVPARSAPNHGSPNARFAADGPTAWPPAEVGPATWALLAWSLWCLGYAVALMRRQGRVERFLKETSEPASPHLRALLADCRSALGIRRVVQLRTSDELPSPATTGLRRPAVFLPGGEVDRLSAQQLRFVLLHELTHVRRADVLVEGLLRCLRAAFFFHPAAWLTVPLVHRWRELACDEAALARTGSTDRAQSAHALLTFAAPARDLARDRVAVAHLLDHGETMKTRIHRLLDPSRRPRTGLDNRGLFAVTVLCGVALTAARAQQAVQVPNPPTESPAAVRDASIDQETASAERVRIDAALRAGTRWLLDRQEDDGRFGLGATPQGKPRDHNDAFTTGLAIQALLPELQGPDAERVRNALERAAAWLLAQQDAKGRIGGDDPMTMAYGHAQALRGLSMLQQVAPADPLLAAIQKGVEYAEYHRNPYSGWRYHPRDGDNDSKITSLMLLALLEAKRAGAEIPSRSLELGRMLLEQLTDPGTGRTGFVTRGSEMSRFVWKNEDFPRKYSEEPTAMNLLVSLESGDDLVESQEMQRAVGLLVNRPPLWSREKGSIDYSYWQYAAEALHHLEGFQRDLWRKRLVSELAEHQTEAGYWPAVDAWSAAGMESWTTAAAMVALRSIR